MINFRQLPEITGGKILHFHTDLPIETISIDSRKASGQAGTLFFAIKGNIHDGHVYVASLYRSGVRQFVIEKTTLPITEFPDANVLLVESSVDALQKIAGFHRNSFSYPVIGITGSNGKTIIKEWLFQMLSKDQIVVKNPGSYNSQVGVPLSVWQMGSHHQLAIFEAGISRPGEMARLESVIKPTIGIFTNIGSAHDEGFENQEQKIEEKLKLFGNSQRVIYCADHEKVRMAIQKHGLKGFSWGTSENADVKVSFQGSASYLTWGVQNYIIKLPFTDKASIENCMHCIVLMLHLGFNYKKIQRGIDNLRSVPMRM